MRRGHRARGRTPRAQCYTDDLANAATDGQGSLVITVRPGDGTRTCCYDVAVGGTFGGPVDRELQLPQSMVVDHVRLYQAAP